MGAKDRLRHLMAMRAERELSRETPDITADMRSQIANEVSTAVQRHEHVSAAVGRVSNSLKTRTPSPAFSPAKNPKKATSPPPVIAQGLNKAPTPHIPIPVEGRQSDTWATIAKQSYEEQQEYQAQERLARGEKIRQQKQILDEQVALRKSIKAKEATVAKVERQEVDALKQVWDAEQRSNAKAHRNIADKLRVDREAQVAERRHRREIEADERRKADNAILNRINAEVEDQKLRNQQLKEREIRMKDELILANEQQKKIKDQHRAHEEELEAKCLREMEARLEKQTRDRERAFKAMKEKMKGREAMAMELQATIDERAQQDEAKALCVAASRTQAQEEKEQAEKNKRKEGLLKVLEFQYKQIEERNQALEAEKARKVQEKAEADMLVRDSMKIIEAKKKEQRDKIAAQQQLLKDQMMDNNRYQSVIISDEEKRLNKHIIERASGVESPSRFKRNFSPI